MNYVYKITKNDKIIYIGCTNNLRRRKDQHNDNIRYKKSKLGQNWQWEPLNQEDLQVIACFENRKEAMRYERKKTMEIQPELNDNYTSECTRNYRSTFKEYVVIDIKTKTEFVTGDLKTFCKNMNLPYKPMQDTVSKTHLCKERYKVFYKNDWYDVEDKEVYWSKKFIPKVKRNGKSYEVLFPDGTINVVSNLDKFAKEHGINAGNLHASYTNNRKAKGYKVIKRI